MGWIGLPWLCSNPIQSCRVVWISLESFRSLFEVSLRTPKTGKKIHHTDRQTDRAANEHTDLSKKSRLIREAHPWPLIEEAPLALNRRRQISSTNSAPAAHQHPPTLPITVASQSRAERKCQAQGEADKQEQQQQAGWQAHADYSQCPRTASDLFDPTDEYVSII